MTATTPLLRQYQKIKSQYKNAILFFRMGDFYEMFYDDAKIASKELGIVLTTRNREKDLNVPMAGIPYHAADSYITRLIKRGYRVAICEQVEDPKLAKGLVRREVVRLITPGTVIEGGLLSDRMNNYLAGLTLEFGPEKPEPTSMLQPSSLDAGPADDLASCTGFGIAFADLSTGEFLTTEFRGKDSGAKLTTELARFRPSECIYPSGLRSSGLLRKLFEDFPRMMTTPWEDNRFEHDIAYAGLLRHFKLVSLDGFGCEGKHLAVSAAGAVLSYLEETQKKQLGHFNSISTFASSDYLVLDSTTLRNLEIFANIRDGTENGTLLGVLDRTLTSMGSRMLRKWLQRPLLDIAEIERRLSAVDLLCRNVMLRTEAAEAFKRVHDLERLISRIAYGNANARDLVALKQSLKVVPQISALFGGSGKIMDSELLRSLVDKLDPLPEIVKLIDDVIVEDPPLSVREGGIIKAGSSSELDELRRSCTDGKGWISKLEATERQRTGIKSLRVGYTKIFGYYIEVGKANLNMVPPDYIRKQTIVSGERFITPELKEKESMVISASEKQEALEYKLFDEVRLRVGNETLRVQRTANMIAQLDCLNALANVALDNNYCKPVVVDDDEISISDGRHPVVEHMVESGFVPNDAHLDCGENQLMILTGPNMAGKSTYMRQIGLIVLMAQAGSFVPATSARIGLVDRIFTRVGAFDDLTHGQSTFMVEMLELANILNSATPHSLVLLDEIGRGTSTFDGLAIAWAVTEHIHGGSGIGAKTIFATHYHQLTELESSLPGINNYHIAVKEEKDRIIFLRKVERGGSSRSYGIQVAQLAGLPQDVIQRAKRVLSSIELDNRILMEYTSPEQEQTEPAKRKRIIVEPRKITQMVFDPNGGKVDTKRDTISDELELIDVEKLTPLEALNKLNELKKKSREMKR